MKKRARRYLKPFLSYYDLLGSMQGVVRHPTWSFSDGHPSGTGSARMMPLVFLNVGYSLVSSLKISCQSVKGQETSLSQPLLCVTILICFGISSIMSN